MSALSPNLFIAFLGGVVPSLLWLSFWLFEDSIHPEPKRYLFLTFVLGMLVVWPVLKLEEFFVGYATGTALLLFWAGTEEVGKFVAALLGGILWPVFDEPLDAVIYMVTAALGFAAMENMLFLFGSSSKAYYMGLLPAIYALSVQRYSTHSHRRPLASRWLTHTLKGLVCGASLPCAEFILATALHTLFNFFILGQGGDATFGIFFCIWVGIVAILLSLERIKNPENYTMARDKKITL